MRKRRIDRAHQCGGSWDDGSGSGGSAPCNVTAVGVGSQNIDAGGGKKDRSADRTRGSDIVVLVRGGNADDAAVSRGKCGGVAGFIAGGGDEDDVVRPGVIDRAFAGATEAGCADCQP